MSRTGQHRAKITLCLHFFLRRTPCQSWRREPVPCPVARSGLTPRQRFSEDGSLVVLEAVCEASQLDAVIHEVEELLVQAAAGVSPAELERSRRLLDHGHRFSLEAIGPVTQLLGQSTLTGRMQGFDAPLQRLASWNCDALQPLAKALDPSLACVLEVRPL